MTALSPMSNSDNYPTFETNWPAHLVARGSSEPCKVLSISLAGARVERSGGKPLPTTCRLVIDEPKFRATCAVVAGNDGEVGLRFVNSTNIPLPLVLR